MHAERQGSRVCLKDYAQATVGAAARDCLRLGPFDLDQVLYVVPPCPG